jgi:NAD(P)-dependent dehydrogenase (short-subunit alcohol dehydrogenase family)
MSSLTTSAAYSRTPRLQEKVAVITGGNRGLGRAIAAAFAAEGAHLVLAARTESSLEETAHHFLAAGVPTLAVATDVSQEAEVERLLRLARDYFGRIDILVNNASISGPTAPVSELGLAEWNRTLGVNLTGPFLCARAALQHMVPRGAGVIVNVASLAGLKWGEPLRAPYAAAKAGLVGLTQTLAQEVAGRGVRVNAICPGPLAGEQTERVLRRQAERTGRTLAELRTEMAAQSSLGRFVQAEECAREAVWLCSDDAAAVTGETIDLTTRLG